jgi:hypothetical protein
VCMIYSNIIFFLRRRVCVQKRTFHAA